MPVLAGARITTHASLRATFLHCVQLVHGSICAPLTAQGTSTTPLEAALSSKYAFVSAALLASSCRFCWALWSLFARDACSLLVQRGEQDRKHRHAH